MTTTTQAAHAPINVYDAVLGECEDLLKASLEAQRLGRLKMASAYQMLLHTRLVGLGKRFDRTTIAGPVKRKRPGDDEEYEDDDEDDYDDDHHHHHSSTSGLLEQNPPASALAAGTPDNEAANGGGGAGAKESGAAAAASDLDQTLPDNLPPALQQLTSILPSNLEMDTTMMEHLARAAVELHHQRTGRKKSADGLLASPMTGLIGSPDTTATPSEDPKPKKSKKEKKDAIINKVAWTEEEQRIVVQGHKEKKLPYAIAKDLPTKTEAQVKAFLKNQEKQNAQASAMDDEMASPNSKKRGGRGRKPPTTAMNTVPNANLDAKALLLAALKRQKR